jgi:Protein of unknown function (DUF3421)
MGFKHIFVGFFLLIQSLVNAGLLKLTFKDSKLTFHYFTEWKAYSDPNAPARDGISAGLNEFGKKCYVGRGTYNGQLAPGKLMTEDAVGLYFEHSYKEHLITSGVEYYAKEASCDYKWVPSSNGQVVNHAIQFKSGSYTFYIGRTFSFNSTQVGKVTLELNVMYYAYGGKGQQTSSYEVLVCEKVIPTTTDATATTANPIINELNQLNSKLTSALKNKVKLIDEQYKKISVLETQLSECREKIVL